ncbi:GTPase [Clostridium saccharobutylicum]|uniref:G domain-containing protein n=1 Tax=Clostridium saccharobutylicum DSM 13864 TaxID=1345695 RepID=U5MR76_CLOSA|nr:GTPase [Clostridium saccharobutylicum]AGX41902.1 hypothetical protein CLSA_c08900 [Clostridium saccharobutylicum DSM 13864]AQR89180.1 GTPase Era [Clostridium saccharobutylicum]AQR99081.1 GTPase Era [Clostridium saccharobutylicum]AQS08803.1 GTPase Era [Clostridium saccharobutylicum]AQS13069.1 GTPase Era [Clostridium saccharobutylicum]
MESRILENTDDSLNNLESIALLGYVVTCNNQIHVFQVQEIKKYLAEKEINEKFELINDIFKSKEETAVTLETALDYFSNENQKTQKELYLLTVILSEIDGSFDNEEREILKKIRIRSCLSDDIIAQLNDEGKKKALDIRNEEIEKTKPKDEEISLYNKMKIIIRNFLLFIRGKLKFKDITKIENSRSNKEYFAAIEKSIATGKNDFKYVQPICNSLYNKVREVGGKLNLNINNLKDDVNISEESVKVIEGFSDLMNKTVLQQMEAFEKEFIKKERTLSDFTISLIGRTKAGKTTLHSILTGGDKADIGVGMQRTTRFNKVFQWRKLRIIDTPGIGAAEDGGRIDDEIAESILSESDIICFVVSDDSIQKDILELLEKITQRNKPTIILLNHKENIRNNTKYKHYITKPNKWFEDKDGVSGHINRIESYIKTKKLKNLVTICPVFLLSAIMAEEEEYSKDKLILRQASKIDDFLNVMQKAVINKGCINRSQTIIDDTIGIYSSLCEEIKYSSDTLKNLKDKLDNKREQALKRIDISRNNFVNDSEKYLRDQYKILKNQLTVQFAEKYYDADNLNDKWSKFIKEIRFEEDLTSKLNEFSLKFTDDIHEVVKEISEDIEISLESININNLTLNSEDTFSFKGITRILGSAMSAIGAVALFVLESNPIGWILTGIGMAIGFFSGFFKSKEQKRQEAISNIVKKLKDNIESGEDSSIKKQIDSIESECEKVINSITELFENIIGGINEIETIVKELTDIFDQDIEKLNKLYAIRLIEYINMENSDENMMDMEDIISVSRKYSQYMNIVTDKKLNVNLKLLDNLIQDNVTINNISEVTNE